MTESFSCCQEEIESIKALNYGKILIRQELNVEN